MILNKPLESNFEKKFNPRNLERLIQISQNINLNYYKKLKHIINICPTKKIKFLFYTNLF